MTFVMKRRATFINREVHEPEFVGDLDHKSLHFRVIPISLSMSELLIHASIVNLSRDRPLVFHKFEPLAHPLFGDQIVTL